MKQHSALRKITQAYQLLSNNPIARINLCRLGSNGVSDKGNTQTPIPPILWVGAPGRGDTVLRGLAVDMIKCLVARSRRSHADHSLGIVYPWPMRINIILMKVWLGSADRHPGCEEILCIQKQTVAPPHFIFTGDILAIIRIVSFINYKS